MGKKTQPLSRHRKQIPSQRPKRAPVKKRSAQKRRAPVRSAIDIIEKHPRLAVTGKQKIQLTARQEARRIAAEKEEIYGRKVAVEMLSNAALWEKIAGELVLPRREEKKGLVSTVGEGSNPAFIAALNRVLIEYGKRAGAYAESIQPTMATPPERIEAAMEFKIRWEYTIHEDDRVSSWNVQESPKGSGNVWVIIADEQAVAEIKFKLNHKDLVAIYHKVVE